METTTDTFIERLMGFYTGGLLTLLIDVGHRTGLFVAAAKGPATSDELAARAGLQERYVREWLAALVTGGVFDYDPATRTYTFPPDRAAFLTGDSPLNMAPHSRMVSHFGHHLAALTTAFREGGGVPYEAFRPEFTDLMDEGSRRGYDTFLVDGYLTCAEGLADRLREGIAVADLGCGTGHAINVMAKAFPASSFTGFDLAEDAIERARVEASAIGLTNATFAVQDVTRFPGRYGLVCAFDAIHDQADPAAVLRRAYEALEPGGVFLMIDINASSNLEDNIGNPIAPFLYAISVMHCMTVSLAQGGAGLGTVWGRELAQSMLADAGFEDVSVHQAPTGDPANCVYVCRKNREM